MNETVLSLLSDGAIDLLGEDDLLIILTKMGISSPLVSDLVSLRALVRGARDRAQSHEPKLVPVMDTAPPSMPPVQERSQLQVAVRYVYLPLSRLSIACFLSVHRLTAF